MRDLNDQSFYHELVKCGLYSNVRNLQHHLTAVFGSVPCSGRNVLDIGGGTGLLSFCAVHRGAAKAVLLEPLSSGSNADVMDRFRRAEQALDMRGRVVHVPLLLQQFDPKGERFDLVLAHNSINHLDQEACITLHESVAARECYLHILSRLRAMLNPGAHFIIGDCARRNLAGDLGLRNPLAPNIGWRKHQSPYTWAQLLLEAGFVRPQVRWTTFNTLGAAGRLFLGNAAAAYLTRSHFRLVVMTPHRPSGTRRA